MENLEICRVCTSYVNSTNATNLFERSKRNLLLRIKDITGKILKNEKDLPRYICPPCEENLQRAYSFRKLCLESQTYFCSSKYLSKIKRSDTKNIDINKRESFNEFEEEPAVVIIKEEFAQTDPIENDELDCTYKEKTNTSLDESNHTPDSQTPNSTTSEFQYADESSKSLTNTTSNAKKKLKNSKKNKAVKCKTRKPNKKIDMICDQCGNHFTCRHHFVTHLRRHSNDKPFKCEVCPDKFYTQPELKRHMRKHTGEKPFECRHCQRKFSDYSTRLKHERIHTNERPFLCSQCGKAFATTYVLKNHMLVHTGERSFKCTLCNKAFQRRTHLLVHYRSLMHKQMVEKQEYKEEFPLNLEA